MGGARGTHRALRPGPAAPPARIRDGLVSGDPRLQPVSGETRSRPRTSRRCRTAQAGGLTFATFSKRCFSSVCRLALGAARQHLGDEGSARRRARRRRTPPPPRRARRSAGGRSACAPRTPPPCPTSRRPPARRARPSPRSSAPVLEEVELVDLGARRSARPRCRSMPSTRPCRALPDCAPSAFTRCTATWHQPPGAQPRSTTRAPGSRKRNRSSSSRILKAARPR